MEVYIYSGHIFGDLYVLTEEQDEDSLYCEECGDSDYLELHTNSIWEVREWLRSQLDVFGLGGYSEEYLNTIERSAQNLLSIVNNILDFTKLESQKLTLESIPFSLRTKY